MTQPATLRSATERHRPDSVDDFPGLRIREIITVLFTQSKLLLKVNLKCELIVAIKRKFTEGYKMIITRKFHAALFLFVFLSAFSLNHQPFYSSGSVITFPEEDQMLTAFDLLNFDRYGSSISISNDVLAIGAPGDDPINNPFHSGDFTGSVYIYSYNDSQWTFDTKLTAPDYVINDQFGSRVDLSGNRLAIGAPGVSNNLGAVYIYENDGSGWSLKNKILNTSTPSGRGFGHGISLNGDTLFVGTSSASPDIGNGPIQFAGAVQVFLLVEGEWIYQTQLTASDAQPRDFFGGVVSSSGDILAVSAAGVDPDLGNGPISNAGAAYIFTRIGSNWVETQKITSSDAEAEDGFGSRVSLRNDVLVAGAVGESPDLGLGPIDRAGSAYVFRFNGISWVEEDKLIAEDSYPFLQLGISIAIDEDIVVIGTQNGSIDPTNPPYSGTGAAYVFYHDAGEWYQAAKLVSFATGPQDVFGSGVVINGTSILVAAFVEDVDSPTLGDQDQAGAVHVFSLHDFSDPIDALTYMLGQISSYELNSGIKNHLSSQINATINSLSMGNINSAINKIEGLLQFINAQNGVMLTFEQYYHLHNELDCILSFLE